MYLTKEQIRMVNNDGKNIKLLPLCADQNWMTSIRWLWPKLGPKCGVGMYTLPHSVLVFSTEYDFEYDRETLPVYCSDPPL